MSTANCFHVLKAELIDLDRYSRILHLRNTDEAVFGVARGIASSPLWSEMPNSELIVRRSPPIIAVLGDFDAAGESRLKTLAQQIKRGTQSLRYVDYSQTEKDCRLLVNKLVERFGRSELDRFCYTAIPRGGIIILGILSYILGLKPKQLGKPLSTDVPLIVVDDCSLTGCRIGNFLEECQSDKIIFAPLYSHPDLRSAIEAKEPRIMACLSAHDLEDPWEEPDDDRLACRERWLARLGDRRYWIGPTEYICFAWNEPDQLFWNPAVDRVESGWHLLPPELCLKNMVGLIPIQIQPEFKGPLCPTDRTIFACHNREVLIGDTESGKSFRLEGVAADIWKGIVKCGVQEQIVDLVLKEYEIDEQSLRWDVSDFVEDLMDRGLLEKKYA